MDTHHFPSTPTPPSPKVNAPSTVYTVRCQPFISLTCTWILAVEYLRVFEKGWINHLKVHKTGSIN